VEHADAASENPVVFERTALSKQPDSLIAAELKRLRDEDKLSPDLVFRDPYVLDFLGLKDTYAEHDLEKKLHEAVKRARQRLRESS
jgi:predicted nuclease of restriction endonuclease-like (RecB) superfamily